MEIGWFSGILRIHGKSAKYIYVRCNHNTGSITDIIFDDCKVKKIGPLTIFPLSIPVLTLFVFHKISLQKIQS